MATISRTEKSNERVDDEKRSQSSKLFAEIADDASRAAGVSIERLTDEELDDIRERCEPLAKAEKISESAVRLTGKKARQAADRVTD